jgi:hypothetical protein
MVLIVLCVFGHSEAGAAENPRGSR